METAQFADSQFVSAASWSAAATLPKASLQAHGQYLHTPGVLNSAAVTIAYSGMIATLNLSNVEFLFGDGTQCVAIGTTDGASSSNYAVNLASAEPSSGSAEVYIVAEKYTVQQGAFQVVGPPIGHPDYDPTFAAYTAYSQLVDSVQVLATTTVPDNVTMLELGRVLVSAGQTSATAVDTSHQPVTCAVLNAVVTAETVAYPTSITVQSDGRVTNLVGGVASVQQGTGINQTPNVVKIGWSEAGKLKATVDTTDEGNIALETWSLGTFARTVNGTPIDGNGNIAIAIPGGTVKTVNGTGPDASGNVGIYIPPGTVTSVDGIGPTNGDVELGTRYVNSGGGPNMGALGSHSIALGWDGTYPKLSVDGSDEGALATQVYANGTFDANTRHEAGGFQMRFGRTVTGQGIEDRITFVDGNGNASPFPNGCLSVVCTECNAQPDWSTIDSPTVYGVTAADSGGFYVSAFKNQGGAWIGSGGSGFSYIAFGY